MFKSQPFASASIFSKLFFLLTLILAIVCGFESLLDSSLYSINWLGPSHFTEPLNKDNIILTTNNQETYQCILPEVDEKTRLKNEQEYSSAKLELEYLRPLLDDDVCTYRLELYWTYELCYSKHIRQFHEEKEVGKPPKLQEYYLGKYGRERYKADLNRKRKERDEGVATVPKKKKVSGHELPYYEVIYEDGTICDLTGVPRRSHVQFVCHSDGQDEIYELKETSSCEYEIVVLTRYLCQHPLYGPKKTHVHSINCHSIGNSPTKPSNLNDLELDRSLGKYNKDIISTILNMVETLIDDDDDDDGDTTKSTQAADQSASTPSPPATQESHPDRKQKHVDTDPVLNVPPSSKHILRDFLSGDYCIEGGTGWWKHEFCFGKFIRQYHDDQNGRHEIKLGVWNEEKHLSWIDSNPLKRPKPVHERKSLYNLYTGGDYCEETKKQRMVEVRFDCSDKGKMSNAISLYLLESTLCEYRLIVESSLFCEMIKSSDDNGLINYKI